MAGFVAPGAALAQSLEESLIQAYQSNPTLQAERAHLRAIDETVPQALANWRPTVVVSGGGGYEQVTSPPTPASVTDLNVHGTPVVISTPAATNSAAGWTPNWDATVTQPIYRGGRTVAEASQAELTVEAERAHLMEIESETLASVAQSYLDVVRDQDLYDIAVANEQLLRSLLQGLETQLSAKVATAPDRLQVDADYATASAARDRAEQALNVSRGSFLAAVGQMPKRLGAPKLRPTLPTSRDQAVQQAETKNPNVIAALFSEDAAAKAVEVVRGGLLPTLSIVGDYGQIYTPPTAGLPAGTTTERSILAVGTVPLYEGGGVYAQTRQALQTYAEMRNETDVARRVAVQAAGAAWDTLSAARASLPKLAHASDAAKQAYEGIHQQQLFGTRSMTDVLVAEQAEFANDAARVTALHDEAVAEFALAQQLGTLTASDLKLDVPLYDVDKHYRSVRYKLAGFGSEDQ